MQQTIQMQHFCTQTKQQLNFSSRMLNDRSEAHSTTWTNFFRINWAIWNSHLQGTPSNAETDGAYGELRGPACTLQMAARPGTWSL
jgi:hypothetical protein